MSVVLGIIIGLLMLMILVVAHEFGHFIAAKRNGVEVEEFGIGFMPRAIAWRKVGGKWRRLTKKEWKNPPGKGTIISLNWLPIGGFCQMKGESDADTEQGSFGAASFWKKTKILFAGVAMNWLVAFVVLTVLAFIGMPHIMEVQFTVSGDTRVLVKTPVTITSVFDDTPAKKVGLMEGDIIRQARVIGGGDDARYEILTTDDLLSFDKEYSGKTVYYTFERDGESKMAQVTLNKEDAKYILGAGITGEAYYQSSWSAPIVGIGTTLQMTGETFKGVGKLLVDLVTGAVRQLNPDEKVRQEGAEAIGEAGDAVSGPVGIIGVLFPAVVSNGALTLLFFVAIISISLACMNVLPIPALDGGRWLLIAIYRLRKKKLTKEKEEKIVGRAFMVILAIAVVVTILDVMRFFK